ncbi:DUF2851 family protein [Pedobacter xixiisoli]|uniref:DUF2851 domain-containing protein n=1 Tax=Pedobacter xixiisoli TaxID=1476464 RepID=A0A285ZP20_9SPHI|nr:DUF2851 family protein [Pedobacter xixiisoli]SOD11421.1 Protein of unknown function [Pedobacter xixiisoli]
MRFPEEFLHFVWQFRLYDALQLQTVDGKALKILNCGFPNKHAGPDFSNAKIVIDDTTWAGQVEVHLKSSDWNVHQHQHDYAYENVVLHVVWDYDIDITRADGTIVPTLSLKNKIPQHLFENYQDLIASTYTFPCEQQIGQVDDFVVNGFLSRVLVERLEHKSKEVFERLAQLNGNWDETFYHFMARNFGFKVNALPMQLLAQSLPQTLFAKHKDQPLQIEALIFGQAGFLNQSFERDYSNKLKSEYDFLRKKYVLLPIDISLWKFLRMRPQNFPTLRLAQFAALIVKSSHLFSKVLEVKNVKELHLLFEELDVNEFWLHHYHFNKEAEKVSVQLGKSSIDNLLINTVSLFLFAYGKYTSQANYQTRALYLLESIAAEKNAIVSQYLEAGVIVENACQTQALLQLRKGYCNDKKCLNCGIGLKILKKV